MRKKPPAAGKGRTRGVPNRVTIDVRQVLTLFIEHNSTKAQALFDRVARKNPAKALELFARLCEFVLPRMSRAEVLLPSQDTSGIFAGVPVTAESAAAAYMAIIGAPIGTDLSRITFEVPAPKPIEDESLPALEDALQALDDEVLPDYEPSSAPGLEPYGEPDSEPGVSNVTSIAEWSKLGRDA